MSYLRVGFFPFFFCLLLEHLVEVRPGAWFQPGKKHRSDQEGNSSVPRRIVQTLRGCLHSSLLELGVQSGIFIVLPQQFYTAALLHFCSLKSVLFPSCYSIPSCWHPWVHVIQPRRYFQGHLVFFPRLHSSNCKTFLSLLTLRCFHNAGWKQWYNNVCIPAFSPHCIPWQLRSPNVEIFLQKKKFPDYSKFEWGRLSGRKCTILTEIP